VLLDEFEVLLDADHRSRVAWQSDDGERAEDSVDRASFESEPAQVGAGEQRAGRLEERRS
jgi:hypothetical protein